MIHRAGLILSLGLLVAAAPPAGPQAAPAADEYAKVQPLLAKYCHSCHGDKAKPKADLNMVKFTSEASIRAGRKMWKDILAKTASHEMPPEEAKAQPTPLDREKIVKWIEAVLKKPDPSTAPNPGRVTLRRLNRVEYSNTVRELVGVDFDPAEDFPSDDIGHGFDNIGDVLTLPPLLMERYLSAAEGIMARAFPVETPKPREDHSGAKYLEPAGERVPQGKFRPVGAGKGDPIRTGPLHRSYRLEPDGEYTFRFRAYAKAKPVKVAVLLSGRRIENPAGDADVAALGGAALQGLRPFRILSTHDITAMEEGKAQKIEVKVPPTRGVEKIAVALFKMDVPERKPEPVVKKDGPPAPAPAADPVPEVLIESFHLSGPTDPRPAFQRRTLASVAGLPKSEQARTIVKAFATRAYRRPVSDVEIARLVAKVDQIVAGGGSLEAGLQIVFQAMLCSPKFLFRVELDDRPVPGGFQAIGEFALASRLSYFLWSSMPDEELMGLAGQGKLTANLEPQVQRMLKDPRSRSLVDQFGLQWLQLKRISAASPDEKMFQGFNYVRRSMLKETEHFLDAVFRGDRSLLELIDADYTFLDERLANFYGIGDTAGNPKWGAKNPKPGGQPIRGDTFVKVSLQGRERGGLLTQASMLTVTSNPTRTSPVKRGRWVLEQILGTPPPPPPPDAPELPEVKAEEAKGTLRQRFEQHRADPKCANCHTRMDAIGFALENYNAVGIWRTKDGAFDVDAKGVFPDGTSFNGVSDLKKVLLQKKDLFARCITEKLLIFALGRGLEAYDDAAVEKITAALAKNEYRFSTLAAEIAKSDPFRLRRAAP